MQGKHSSHPLPFSAAVYDPTTRTVTLTLDRPLANARRARTTLTVFGSLSLTDLAGNRLDGNADGSPGCDFMRRLSEGVILSDRGIRSALDEVLLIGDPGDLLLPPTA